MTNVYKAYNQCNSHDVGIFSTRTKALHAIIRDYLAVSFDEGVLPREKATKMLKQKKPRLSVETISDMGYWLEVVVLDDSAY